jgi:hypothetical protein
MLLTRHGDVAGVVSQILDAKTRPRTTELKPQTQFSKHTLLPELIDILEAEPKSEPYSFVREVTLP